MEIVLETDFAKYLAGRTLQPTHITQFSWIFSTYAFLSKLEHITNVKIKETILQKTFWDIYWECVYRMLVSILYLNSLILSCTNVQDFWDRTRNMRINKIYLWPPRTSQSGRKDSWQTDYRAVGPWLKERVWGDNHHHWPGRNCQEIFTEEVISDWVEKSSWHSVDTY